MKPLATIKPLALVGMMGSGKSTVGALVAQHIGCAYVDLDVLLEKRLGDSIAHVFSLQGEPFFRQQEHLALGWVMEHLPVPYVLATGGGTPLNPVNAEWLRSRFFTVWLDAAAPLLYERAALPHRPLAAFGALAFYRLASDRQSHYRGVAQWRIDVSESTPEALADAVARRWKGEENG